MGQKSVPISEQARTPDTKLKVPMCIWNDTTPGVVGQDQQERAPRSGRDDLLTQWRLSAERMRNDLEAKLTGATHANPWTLAARCRGLGEVSTHTREKLEIGFLLQCVKKQVLLSDLTSSDAVRHRRDVAKGLFVDVSQGLSRYPWRSGRVPTAVSQSKIYSYELDKRLTIGELWAGYGRCVLPCDGVSHTLAADLLGNCMAAQPIATVLHALIAALGSSIPDLWR